MLQTGYGSRRRKHGHKVEKMMTEKQIFDAPPEREGEYVNPPDDTGEPTNLDQMIFKSVSNEFVRYKSRIE